jgi:hypothetical protein
VFAGNAGLPEKSLESFLFLLDHLASLADFSPVLWGLRGFGGVAEDGSATQGFHAIRGNVNLG